MLEAHQTQDFMKHRHKHHSLKYFTGVYWHFFTTEQDIFFLKDTKIYWVQKNNKIAQSQQIGRRNTNGRSWSDLPDEEHNRWHDTTWTNMHWQERTLQHGHYSTIPVDRSEYIATASVCQIHVESFLFVLPTHVGRDTFLVGILFDFDVLVFRTKFPEKW